MPCLAGAGVMSKHVFLTGLCESSVQSEAMIPWPGDESWNGKLKIGP